MASRPDAGLYPLGPYSGPSELVYSALPLSRGPSVAVSLCRCALWLSLSLSLCLSLPPSLPPSLPRLFLDVGVWGMAWDGDGGEGGGGGWGGEAASQYGA